MKLSNKPNPSDASAVAAAIGEYLPEIAYGGAMLGNQQNAVAAFLAYDDDLLDEIPFADEFLDDYRELNELC